MEALASTSDGSGDKLRQRGMGSDTWEFGGVVKNRW